MATKTKLPYGERAKHHPNALARRLFEIAEAKQTNITVSADLTTTEELLSIAEGGLHIAGVVLSLPLSESMLMYLWFPHSVMKLSIHFCQVTDVPLRAEWLPILAVS